MRKEPSPPYAKEFQVFDENGKETGRISMQMGSGRSRSTVQTPWGQIEIVYDQHRPMNFGIVKDGKPLADANHTIRKPIIILFADGKDLTFKVKAFTAKLVSKSNSGSYEIHYGQLSGESFLRTAPRGEGFRRWRISIQGDATIDKNEFFLVLSAFTCHLYEMLWPEYPDTLDSINCFPVGD